MVMMLLVLTTLSFGKKLATLGELAKPTFMAIDNEQCYIVERANIFIYSLKDFRLIKKFGKSGEGPREFRISRGGESVQLFVHGALLWINSKGKLSTFDKKGNFIKEVKTPAPQQSGMFQPIGDRIAGFESAVDAKDSSMYFAINLYDSQFNVVKELKRIKFFQKGGMTLPMIHPACYVAGNNVVFPGELKKFQVNIFDLKKDKITSIYRDYKPLKMTEKYKKDVFTMFKAMPDTKQIFEWLKKVVKFRDEFPPIQGLMTANDRVYILTYLEKDGKSEFFIYDMNGKFVKRIFLPLYYLYGARPAPLTFNNGKFYQLVENQDNEEWELHSIDVK